MLYEHGLLEETNNHKKTRNELFYDYIGFDFEKIRTKKILVFGAGAAGGTITYWRNYYIPAFTTEVY